jgi:peroxin-5
MSFLGGAECSTAGNPLSQFTKHVQDDKSLQRDRLVGRAPGGGMQGMRSTNGINGSQDNVGSACPIFELTDLLMADDE